MANLDVNASGMELQPVATSASTQGPFSSVDSTTGLLPSSATVNSPTQGPPPAQGSSPATPSGPLEAPPSATPATSSSEPPSSSSPAVEPARETPSPEIANGPGQANAIVITEASMAHLLGFGFSSRKKWAVLTVIFVVQLSMNFNASVYANAIGLIAERYSVAEWQARMGQLSFLVAYGVGSELWAPWSEEKGRRGVLQASLGMVNVAAIVCAVAPSYPVLMFGRTLGGLCSAGGSVTLGMVADMWGPEDQQYAVAYVVLASVGGSALGPIFGGFLQQYAALQWNFWVQLLFGAAAQALHFWAVPETNATTLLDRIARRRRAEGEKNVWAQGEDERRLTVKRVLETWFRPFSMFVTEPIVLLLSLLSGFSDSLIFTFLESFRPVFEQWSFTTVQVGLTFVPIITGYVLAALSFIPWIARDVRRRHKNPDLAPESRLTWLLFTAPCLCFGLFGFAWTSSPAFPWIAPLLFAGLIGLANYAIYMATIDYMIAAYGPYAASATGGNALARDVLAGLAALYSTPFYNHFAPPHRFSHPSTILGVVALLVVGPVYVFYWFGPTIRARSPFAVTLANAQTRLGLSAATDAQQLRRGAGSDTAGGGNGGALEPVPAPAPTSMEPAALEAGEVRAVDWAARTSVTERPEGSAGEGQ